MVSATNNQDGKRDFRRKDSRDRRDRKEESPYVEKVVSVRRVSKVVKGGRNLSFAAFVVIGDENGKVGFSSGKAAAVPDAVRKAVTSAKKDLETIKMKGTTVPHEAIAKYGASKVMIRPASQGTGIIASAAVRAIMEQVGITDILTKINTNLKNIVNILQINTISTSKQNKQE